MSGIDNVIDHYFQLSKDITILQEHLFLSQFLYSNKRKGLIILIRGIKNLN